MTITPEIVTEFHKTLLAACGLPPVRPSYGDVNSWRDFLPEMDPLEDTGTPFQASDIIAAVVEMKRQNAEQRTGWSLRPTKILRDPEAFRDLVLMARSRRNIRPTRPATHLVERTDGDVRRQVEVPAGDNIATAAEVLDAIALFRQST